MATRRGKVDDNRVVSFDIRALANKNFYSGARCSYDNDAARPPRFEGR